MTPTDPTRSDTTSSPSRAPQEPRPASAGRSKANPGEDAVVIVCSILIVVVVVVGVLKMVGVL